MSNEEADYTRREETEDMSRTGTMSMSRASLDNTSRMDADLESVHSTDKAALVWQHMKENSGLDDGADSLYDETGLMGPPWL